MRTKVLLLLAALCLLFVKDLYAEIKLPAIISSNMVLQRSTTVVLWGWADGGEKLSIDASWLDEAVKFQGNKEGEWNVEIQTTGSKDPQWLVIRAGKQEVRLENILFGEVWICSGQSNMQQSLKGYNGQPTFGANSAIARSCNPNLRLFSVDRIGSKSPMADLDKYTPWVEAGPENVADFSAVAYFFGQQLQEILDVPVGMIHTSWGGSSVQAWISKEVFTEFMELDLSEVDITERTNHIPTALFNAMIHPLIPYTIRGGLWYQGESNRLEPGVYEDLFPAMVRDWRDRWGIGNFPFYYVQIAPYWYNDTEVFSDVRNSAYIREAQLNCLELIPNSGMAVTMDIGDKYCIHPPKKKDVANRLLYNALSQTYGMESVDGKSPVYKDMEIKNNEVRITFSNAEGGIFASGELDCFELAGEDRIFYPAKAWIDRGYALVVTSDDVPEPVAVRYGWSNWVEGCLFDSNLLPASSFRTDDWENASRK